MSRPGLLIDVGGLRGGSIHLDDQSLTVQAAPSRRAEAAELPCASEIDRLDAKARRVMRIFRWASRRWSEPGRSTPAIFGRSTPFGVCGRAPRALRFTPPPIERRNVNFQPDRKIPIAIYIIYCI